MKDILINIINRNFGQVRKTKRKVTLDWLQEKLIDQLYSDRSDFELNNGFLNLVKSIEELEKERVLISIQSSAKSYKAPYISTSFWIMSNTESIVGWPTSVMLRLRQHLNLSYYDNHSHEQTVEALERLETIYSFLQTINSRELVTREERSLELFLNEKFLVSSEGERFLRSLELTLSELKAFVCREPFVFYCRDLSSVKTILILENHSCFHSCKRMIMSGKDICGLLPDMLIYGEGWKIDGSILYIEELGLDPLQIEILYAGDMDLKGWEIYATVKRKYPQINLQLATSIYYQMMIECKDGYPYLKRQSCNPANLESVLNELIIPHPELHQFIDRMIRLNVRIPQEVLNCEKMMRLSTK